jgi:hypothetical protein
VSLMGARLTSYPFDDSDGKELRERLAAIYFTRPPIITFMKTAGLKPQNVDLEDAQSIWDQALDQAATSGRLGGLLEVVKDDDESVDVRPLIDRLIARFGLDSPASEASIDVYELALLSPTRSFIGRPRLRTSLKEFENERGARVIVLRDEQGCDHVGRTHSWYYINEIGQRRRIFDSYRFDLTDWSGTLQGPRDVMAEICGQLGWQLPALDTSAQPPTVVRLLVAHFKALGRTLTRRTCLVFDHYTEKTADEWARALVMGIAKAANDGEAGNVCVVLLEVDARLTADLARDAIPEDLGSARMEDLEHFFAAAAAAHGLEIAPGHMPLLVAKVLGAPPHPDELPLRTVGPRAAQVAAGVFGRTP